MAEKCEICGAKDTATTPVLKVSNASEFDVGVNVCSECVSSYDGTYAWAEDGRVVFV